MLGIVIDPFTKTIEAVETEATLADIYKLLGCTTIDAVNLADGRNCIYVDDNGLIYDKPLPVFRWQGYNQPLAGRGLLLGFTEAGENCSTDIALGVVWAHVTFPNIVIDEIVTREYTRGDGTFVIQNIPTFKRTGKE